MASAPTRPIDDHGGAIPPAFHTMRLPDTPNRLTLFVRTTSEKVGLFFYNTLLLNRVDDIYMLVDESMVKQLPPIHPMITYVPNTLDIQTFVQLNLVSEARPHIFWTEVKDTDCVHPNFWTLLETAQPGVSIVFPDETGAPHTLASSSREGAVTQVNTIAAYSSTSERVISAAIHGTQRKLAATLNEIRVDVSQTFSPLCQLATKYMTDKSPYNIMTHRHPYTMIYDMFLRPYQLMGSGLRLGEVGILNGASVRMWREYFPDASLSAFDIDKGALEKVSAIQGVSAYHVDAGEIGGLRQALAEATEGGKKFTVLLEDASHRLDHQLIFLREAIDFVAPGGLLIIEDIFREIPAARFQEALDLISEKVANAVLVQPEHPYRWSPNWNNDRILFVWRR
jgi:hypothetical protein